MNSSNISIKNMKSIIAFLLTLSFIANVKGDEYSVNGLIEYLKQEEYFDIIQEVNIYLGNDIAIGLCKELVPTNHCDEVVKYYMSSPSDPVRPARSMYTMYTPSIEDILINDQDNYNILMRNMNNMELWMLVYKLRNY